MTKAQASFFLFILFFPTIRNFADLLFGDYISIWISGPLFLITAATVGKLINVLVYNNDQARKAKKLLDRWKK